MSKYLVVVESPAKARKIAEYLGKDYRVEASIGHIRDLPEKNMGVDIANNFKPEYEISPSKKKRVTELKSFAKSADEIILATDPDREGEAIAWHLAHIFGLKPSEAKRVTYHEITKSAIADAFAKPAKIDIDLVNAQQSRRILDRIVGYEVSPVLWKKVRPGLSAGRVQSVAVKLLVQREREIRAFVPEESWKLTANLDHETPFAVELTKIGDKKVTLKTEEDVVKFLATHGISVRADSSASAIASAQNDKIGTTLELPLEKGGRGDLVFKKDKKGNFSFSLPHREAFTLVDTEKKSSKRTPGAPFTTSTLQQEASRKLGYSVKTTMDIAQRLYQNGHITYMRTDSVHLSDLAISTAKKFIEAEYGSEYAMPNGRQYKTKQANAQEAHEAIRPTYIDKVPSSLGLDRVEDKLYRLIWERTVASQMKEADIETTTYFFRPNVSVIASGMQGSVAIQDSENGLLRHSSSQGQELQETWIAKGEVIKFAGFMKLYIEGVDEEKDDDTETTSGQAKKLPEVKNGATLNSTDFLGQQKFSLPPARYTEASLVKKLESEGIGRPSTYAATIQTIQDRGYVVIDSKKLVPTDIAFVVTDYLEQEFTSFMQYSFTAEVEEEFDEIARGELEWTSMLRDFYTPFHESINSALGTEGRFSGERILGKDEASGQTILARMSRFGPVIQIGAPSELAEGEKPRYANLAPGMSIDDITLEEALGLFSFPKHIGEYEGKILVVGQGRYGPYVKWGEEFVSIPRTEDAHSVDEARAIELIEAKKVENAPVGMYEGEPYTKGKGRFGPFLKWKNLYVNVPRAIDFDNITPAEAEKLIAGKVEKEANRYIHQWSEEKISVERGRYGPYIKFGKENLYLKRGGKKITDEDEIAGLTLAEVKEIILEQNPDAFGKKKTEKPAKKKTPAKKKNR